MKKIQILFEFFIEENSKIKFEFFIEENLKIKFEFFIERKKVGEMITNFSKVSMQAILLSVLHRTNKKLSCNQKVCASRTRTH